MEPDEVMASRRQKKREKKATRIPDLVAAVDMKYEELKALLDRVVEEHQDLVDAARKLVDSAYEVDAKIGYRDHTCVDEHLLEKVREMLP